MGNGSRILAAATLLVSVAFVSLPQQAAADTLHVFCSSPTPSCLDNGSITPTSSNPATFGFLKDGGSDSDSGTLYLEVLIPNNVAGAASQSFSISSSFAGNPLVNSSLFSATPWTDGQLDAYLFRSATPTNPIGAYLPVTQGYDAGATGYYVYNFNFGAVDFSADDPLFTLSAALPVGTVIDAFFNTCSGKGCTAPNDWVATANSASLILTGPGTGVPEPATLSLLGMGLLGLSRFTRKRAA